MREEGEEDAGWAGGKIVEGVEGERSQDEDE